MNSEFFKRVFRNHPFKTKKGVVYVDPILAEEIIDFNNNSGDKEIISTILIINALSGTLALAARKQYPRARIICIEYFSFEVNLLRRMGFEVVDLQEKVENCNLYFMNNKLQKKIGKGGTVILSNPPYNKIDKRPLYYSFLYQLSEMEPMIWKYIIPNGCLIGPKSKDIRELLFKKLGTRRLEMKGSNTFEGIAQNTVVLHGSVGYQGDIVFSRSQKKIVKEVTFSREEAREGVPQVYGDSFLRLWTLVKQYPTKFEMKRQIPSGTHSVAISDGNGFGGYDETTLCLSEAGRRAIMPVYITTTTKPQYNHHTCKTLQEAINAKSWMEDPLFGVLFLFVRVTHRTIKSNMGQLPMVIVEGNYSRRKVLEKLGADEQLIIQIEEELEKT